MSFFRRLKSSVGHNLPNLAGGIVEVGTEAILEGHGFNPLEAREAAFVASSTVKEIFAASKTPHKDTSVQTAVLRIARVPDLAVTPSWFVYAMPIREHRVEERVSSVAPQIWLNPQAAWIYAEHVARQDMGIRQPPLLVAGDETIVEGKDDILTREAWEMWRHAQKDDPRRPVASVPFGSYVLGELPDGGMIAWRSMLTPQGLRVGTLTTHDNCSLHGSPLVFKSEVEALKTLQQRNLPDPIDVYYMPNSLKNELTRDESGELLRERMRPVIWPGVPVPVNMRQRIDRDPDPVLLRADWYVSRFEGGAVAWRPTGGNEVSFARVRRKDGTWGVASWSSVGKCLKDLGKIGEFGQEHPTLTLSPGVSPRVSEELEV